MSDATPGEAMHDSLRDSAPDAFGRPAGDFATWDQLPAKKQERMEAAAQAAVDAFLSGDSVSAESIREAIAAAEREPQPAPLPHGIALAALECIRQAYEPGTMAHDTAHKALDDTETAREPRPAPELAAAMAESRRYREALEQVAGHHDSRVSVVRIIAKIAKRALEGK